MTQAVPVPVLAIVLAEVRGEVVSGAGHCVHVEQPAPVVAAARRFLARVGP